MAEDETDERTRTDDESAFDEADAEALGDMGDLSGDDITDAEREALAGDDAQDEKEGDGDAGDEKGDTGDEKDDAQGDKDDTRDDVHDDMQTEKPSAESSLAADEDPDEIGKKIAALDTQYDDGDIDLGEYREERDKLMADKIRAETVNDISDQQRTIAWQNAQAAFFVGDDAKFADPNNPPLRAAFAGALHALYNKPENLGMPDEWYLKEAKRQVVTAFGIGPPDKNKTDQERVDDALAARRAPAANIPNVGSLPASGETDLGGSKFDELDALTGLEHEQALAAMSQADQDRYLDR